MREADSDDNMTSSLRGWEMESRSDSRSIVHCGDVEVL